MSGLKDRLRRLTGGGAADAALTGQDGGKGHSAGREAAAEEAPSDSDLFTVEELEPEWNKLKAALVRNEWGSFIRRRVVYPPGYRHGNCLLADLLRSAGELAAFHRQDGLLAEELLFFDTETTGLGLGAGNVPFMIGFGFWEEGGFAIEQLFIRNPAEELAMLTYVKHLMELRPYLVSYNGRAFDWPLLKNRFVMNRMREELAEPLHLDFLYPSRSLWRNALPSCRLGKVEESRLGFQRMGDMPGAMAPSLYFLYLSDRRPESIAPVFLHNELDILSLAGLAVWFAQALQDGSAPLAGDTPEEALRLGLWLYRLGKEELSQQILGQLDNRLAAPGPEELEAALKLAAHYKQLGAMREAVSLWQRIVIANRPGGEARTPPVEPYIELSMYYEHREKDYETALLYAEEALDWLERRRRALASALHRPGPGGRRGFAQTGEAAGRSNTAGELAKRIGRLKAKQHKAAEAHLRRSAGAMRLF